MSTIEWAAGLFEGEGSIPKFNNAKYQYEVKIKMTDLDILERVQSLFGGKIYPQPSSAAHHKPIWQWCISNKAGVKDFLMKILPYLGYRRTYQAQNMLDAIDRCGTHKRSIKAATDVP